MAAAPVTVRTTAPRQLLDITAQVEDAVMAAAGRGSVGDGVALVFCPHTSCGLALNEDEVGFHEDLERVLEQLAPVAGPWAHDDLDRRTQNLTPGVPERPNGWSHVRALLATQPSLTLPVTAGRLEIGRWQRVLLVELDGPRERTVHIRTWGAST